VNNGLKVPIVLQTSYKPKFQWPQWLRRSTIKFFFGLLQPNEQLLSPYVRQMQRLLSFFAFVMCEGIVRTCFEVWK
jgi:hypothetical protein